MIARFLGAVQFLTVVPVRRATASPSQSAVFFPLVGAAIGWCAVAVLLAAKALLPAPIPALLALAFTILATGGLHEDGLADVADAIRAGRSRDQMFAILKDSRVGAFGALAISLSLLLRWQALAALVVDPLAAMVASLTIARAAMVALAWIARPVGQGMGDAFCASLSTPVVLLALLQAAAAGFLLEWRGVPVLVMAVAIVLAARTWFHARLGGINGDCLGATCQAVEVSTLLVLACERCTL